MTQTNAHSKTLLRIMNDHDAQLGDHPSIEVDKSIVETWAGVKIIEPFKEYFSPHYARKLLSTQNNNNTFQFNEALAGSLPEMSSISLFWMHARQTLSSKGYRVSLHG